MPGFCCLRYLELSEISHEPFRLSLGTRLTNLRSGVGPTGSTDQQLTSPTLWRGRLLPLGCEEPPKTATELL